MRIINNMSENPETHTIPLFTQVILDPGVSEFLPPDIKALLEKQMRGGSPEMDKLKQNEENLTPPTDVRYNFNMVNASENIKEFVDKLVKSPIKKYAILLYGESGSGKSFLGKYIAQQLGMPIIKKRASDLIDKWVGQTEQNVRGAFQEATKKKAILLLDESDTFLYDRTYSQREFEVSQVNELLTQMEDFEYPLIMTTNLKEKIDKASMRRFIFKIKFDYMKPENVIAGIKEYFGEDFTLTEEQLNKLPHLCAGDFSLIQKKIEILENTCSNELIYQYLLKEQEEKDIKESSNIVL